MKQLKHKGYVGSVEINLEDNCLYGKIEFINDLVTYEGETIEELKTAFVESVEDYIETCAELGQKPEKPFKGSFNIRLGADLHKRVAIKAKQEGISLNHLIINAVEIYLDPKTEGPSIHIHTHANQYQYATKIPDWTSEYGKGVTEWATADPLKH